MQNRGTPPVRLVRQAPDHRVTSHALAPTASTPPILTNNAARQHCTVWPNALARHLQAQVIQARERAQVGAIKGSIGHVEVFRMDGVGISIIGRPRPLPGHDTPNPTQHPYTLKCEEPLKCRPPRRKTLTMVCRGRGGLRCGHNGACRLCHQSFAALDRRMGPTREGRPHSRGRGRMGGPRPLARPRGVWVVWRSPRGQRLVTCRQVPVQRQSYRPLRRDTPGRTRGRREDRRSCGRSRTRGLRAGSGHRRGGPRASCRPS